MVLKTLQCCVDASFLEQKSALGEIHPLNPQQGCIRLLGGGLLPINPTHWHGVQCLMWGIRGPFLLVAAMVVMVTVYGCSMAGAQTTFTVKSQHIGYLRKALVLSKTILVLY